MNKKLVIAILLALPVIGFLGYHVATMPVAALSGKAEIGTLDLESESDLSVEFTSPKSSSSFVLEMPNYQGAGGGPSNWSEPMKEKLAVRLWITDVENGMVILDQECTEKKMIFTSWHDNPSVNLSSEVWLPSILEDGKRYRVSLATTNPNAGFGRAKVHFHWGEYATLTGASNHSLDLTAPVAALPPQ
jgi:hypothetical protein